MYSLISLVVAATISAAAAAPSGLWAAPGAALAGPVLGSASLAGPAVGAAALAGSAAGPARLSGAVHGGATVTGAVAGPSVVSGSVVGGTLETEPSLGWGAPAAGLGWPASPLAYGPAAALAANVGGPAWIAGPSGAITAGHW